MEIENKNKRIRSANFTTEDCMKLVQCVLQHKHVVENKKTDAVTWKEKERAWDIIAQEYNSLGTTPRSTKNLREKFDSLKKETRKQMARERQSYIKTGGGPAVKVEINPLFLQIKEILQLSAEGLPSIFDSDVVHPAPVMLEESVDIEINEPSASSFSDILLLEMDADDVTPLEHVQELDIPSTSSQSMITSEVSQKATSSHQSWAEYNPSKLKTPKSKPLKAAIAAVHGGRSSPSGKGARPKEVSPLSQNGQKIGTWAVAKKELAVLQKELLKKEFDQREKREQELHECDVKIREIQLKHAQELHDYRVTIKQLKIRNLQLDIKSKEEIVNRQ